MLLIGDVSKIKGYLNSVSSDQETDRLKFHGITSHKIEVNGCQFKLDGKNAENLRTLRESYYEPYKVILIFGEENGWLKQFKNTEIFVPSYKSLNVRLIPINSKELDNIQNPTTKNVQNYGSKLLSACFEAMYPDTSSSNRNAW